MDRSTVVNRNVERSTVHRAEAEYQGAVYSLETLEKGTWV